MEIKQNEADLILGGAPKESVQQFPKPGELSVSELDLILGAVPNEVAVEAALTNQEFYRASQIENLNTQERLVSNDEVSSSKRTR